MPAMPCVKIAGGELFEHAQHLERTDPVHHSADRLAGRRAAPGAGQQIALLGHAGGNPLFSEQYAQMLADHAASPELAMSELVVLESVQGIIAARLDLLAPEEKRLLHDAAMIGKVFWPGAVAALSGVTSGDTLGEAGLEEGLHRLGTGQFVRRERAS